MTDHKQLIQALRDARNRWKEDPSPENEHLAADLYRQAYPKTNRQQRMRKKKWHQDDKKKWQGLLKEYGNQCLCCGADGGEDGCLLVPDHVIPLSEGGKDNVSNIQPLCPECNSRKGTNRTDFRKSFPTKEFGNVTKHVRFEP